MNPICQISNEPGGDLVLKSSRLFPNMKIWVKKTYWDQGYEPRGLVMLYGQSLIQQSGGKLHLLNKDELFLKIIDKKLYFGDHIIFRDLI